jgi:hypothetical protein
MSTVTTRERRPLNPSSRLTAASNAAEPALSSHRESVAQAQRARAAAEVQNNGLVTPTLLTTTPVLTHVNLDVDDQPRSNAGSLRITPATSSVPPSTAPPSEDNSDKPSATAAKKGKRKQKRRRNSSGGVYQTDLLISLLILNSGIDDTQTDENGMYRDVNIMDIDSDSTDPETKKKNKNAKADIDHFFGPVKHVKGDKCGRRRCKSCM